MKARGADKIITRIGGHGVAAVYRGEQDGPTIMFRSELDALPIQEISALPYRSELPGKGHLCGHDGHSATLVALAAGFDVRRPAGGRVILMFQPAEENGVGAAAVIADPKFTRIRPDMVFSLHNLPGLPLGHVALREGPVTCATQGMKVVLSGKTAHASTPEEGASPTFAIAALAEKLTALSNGSQVDHAFLRVTVTHVHIGEPTFGVSPGHGEIWVTLRSLSDEAMVDLVSAAEAIVVREASAAGLTAQVTHHDVFRQCCNSAGAVAELRRVLAEEGVSFDDGTGVLPMRPGEDFGLFKRIAPTAMMFRGSGESHAGLHNPDFDYPDELIEIGARVFMRCARNILG